MQKRIKANRQVPGAGKIPAPSVPEDSILRFSFKYIDLAGNTKFCTSHCQGGYLDKFLERLRDLSGLKVNEFRTNRSSSLRGHPIDFSETSEPAGFISLNSQLRQNEAWQFAVSANQHGRVHGILLNDTFYLVWIDPGHYLYPSA